MFGPLFGTSTHAIDAEGLKRTTEPLSQNVQGGRSSTVIDIPCPGTPPPPPPPPTEGKLSGKLDKQIQIALEEDVSFFETASSSVRPSDDETFDDVESSFIVLFPN